MVGSESDAQNDGELIGTVSWEELGHVNSKNTADKMVGRSKGLGFRVQGP